ncbi:MAG: hypothetical protein WD830_10385 [Chloroflexota bacterium]
MKLRLGLGGVVLALLMLPATAVAATPDRQAAQHPAHREFEVAGSFADTDFCGTGKTIEVKAKAFLYLHRGENVSRSHGRSRTVFINPANDAMVVLRSAGQLKLRRMAEGTGFAIVASLRGAPALIRTGMGDGNTYRSRDPGYVLYVLHFSEEGKFISSEVVPNDPDIETNRAFRRLCRIATDALGL